MVSDHDLALLCAETERQRAPVWQFAGPTFHATLTPSRDGPIIACEGSMSFGDWLIGDFYLFGPESTAHPDLGTVHAGFDLTTDECLPEIIRAVEPAPGVIVTGHSKGGANAEMLAAKLILAGVAIVRLVTFGTPRWILGNTAKADALLAPALGPSYRHFRDYVTQVPPGRWRHPATREPVEIGGGAWWRLLEPRWMHNIDNYAASLAGERA